MYIIHTHNQSHGCKEKLFGAVSGDDLGVVFGAIKDYFVIVVTGVVDLVIIKIDGIYQSRKD